MSTMETRGKKLPNKRILTKEINSSMTIISNIYQKIQNFTSLLDFFEEEEKIDKIRAEIIDDYKSLGASKTKIKNGYELLPQGDAALIDLYLNYDNELANLTQIYKIFIKESLIGSRTLSMVCNTATNGLGLHIYDLKSQKTHFITSEFFQLGGCTISLPNSRLFIYSSTSSTYRPGFPCILDLKSKAETKLPENLNCLYSGGAYYKNCVYLFGGALNFIACAEVRRFDLEKNLWYHVAPLPEASSMCACTVFKDSILICGVTHEQIYKYDLNTASYSGINSVVIESFTPRVLFKAGSRVYFLERVSGIFESELENEYVYTNIGNSKLEWGSVSQVKHYNSSVWFITAGTKNFQIFKFDLAFKKLNKCYD